MATNRPSIPVTALRLLAFCLVLGGFVGALATDTPVLTLESVYSVAFYVGVICAILSVYASILLSKPGAE